MSMRILQQDYSVRHPQMMASTAPTRDACISFGIETRDQRASESRSSSSYAVCFSFVLGMMVMPIGLLTLQHCGLGDASYMKFFLAPQVPRVQPVSGASGAAVAADLSNKKRHDLSMAWPASIHQPIPPSGSQQMPISWKKKLANDEAVNLRAYNDGSQIQPTAVRGGTTISMLHQGEQKDGSVNNHPADLRSEAALVFGSALTRAWQKDTALLRQVVRSQVDVVTPLFKASSRDEYESEILETADFFSARAPCTFIVLSHTSHGDGSAQLAWQLNVEWPSVWRSRINLVGETVLTFEPSRTSDSDGVPALPVVTSIRETWHQSPGQAFGLQVLPRLRDVMSLWNSPTAEMLQMPVVERRDGYEVRTVPPMLAVQAEWVEVGNVVFDEQAPLPPPYTYTGGVKRTEWYSTVSPGICERSLATVTLENMTLRGQRRTWILPVPGRFCSDLSSLPNPDGGLDKEWRDAKGKYEMSVKYVCRPSQTIAARRVRDVTNEEVLNAGTELAQKVEASGRRVVRKNGQPVLWQLAYDIKYGFNRKKQVAMAVWVSMWGPLEHNEVAVLIDE